MIDAAQFTPWIGKSQESIDIVAPGVVARLAALLDHKTPPWRAGELPPLGHWLFHLPDALQSEIAADGHPAKGGFLPPIPLPRRMWAGSRVRFLGAVPIGADIRRRSTISNVVVKSSGDADMAFVTVSHEISSGGEVRIIDEHDIVYLDGKPRRAGAPVPQPHVADHSRTFAADPVLLFRYSALTFNGHRIHYDRDYATGVEGYPGLVVHGPLLATLLMDHFLRHHPGARVTGFTFRARAPLFDGQAFSLNLAETATGADVWSHHADHGVTVSASVTSGRET